VVSSAAGEAVIAPEADTYVDAAKADTNFGTQASFETNGSDSTGPRAGPQLRAASFRPEQLAERSNDHGGEVAAGE